MFVFEVFSNKKNKDNILLALIVSIITLTSCIFAIDFYVLTKRNFNWVCEICQFDTELGWNTLPNQKATKNNVTYTTNSLGYRAKEIDQSKEHILILGDSVAFGLGVNDDETVSYYIQMEKPKYQVLNLAVSGYSIDQYYLKLKREIKFTNPKYIIPIIFSGNDWFETIQNNIYGINKPFYKIEDGTLVRENPNLSIFSCWNYFHGSWFFNKFKHDLLTNFFCSFKKQNESEGKKIIGILLNKILTLGQTAGAKFIFVLSPTKNDFFVTTCGPGTNFSFCESNHKKYPEFFFNNLNLFQKYLLEQKNKGADKKLDSIRKNQSKHSSWAWYLRFKNLFNDYNLKFLDIHGKIMEHNANIFNMYLENDNNHYSDEGNKFLAEAIVKQLQIGNDKSISE